MLSSTELKKIVTEARPLIEQQLDLTEKVAGLREVVTAAGGDWSQLKALVKAQIQDERDDAGDGKRVRKILDKADYAQGYADMLGLAKMNEKNSFAEGDDDLAGLEALDPKLLEMLIEGSKSGAGLAIITAALEQVKSNSGVPTHGATPAPGGASDTGSSSANNPGEAAAHINSVTHAADPAGEGSDALPADMNSAGESHPLRSGREEAIVSIDRLRSLIAYDPVSGALTWKVDCGRARAGQLAGKVGKRGYRSVQIDGLFYTGHVLAWAIHTGEWPEHLVDHRDRDPSNNSWANLREATFAGNAQNASLRSDSKSGYRGVSWHSQKGKWRAEIQADGVSHFLGLFSDVEDAARAYDQAAVDLHGEFAAINFPVSQGGEVETRRAHNPEIAGAHPAPATSSTAHGRGGSQDSPHPLTQQGIATPGSIGDGAGRPQPATLQSDTSAREVPPRVGTVAPVDTNSPQSVADQVSPAASDAGLPNSEARKGVQATGEAARAPASSVVAYKPKPYAGPHDSKGLPRPVGCLHLDACGSSTWRHICHTCDRARAVEAGGVSIEHQGTVAS